MSVSLWWPSQIRSLAARFKGRSAWLVLSSCRACISGPVKAGKRETPSCWQTARVASNQNAVGGGRSLPPARCARAAYEIINGAQVLSAALTLVRECKLPPLHSMPIQGWNSRFLLQLPSDQEQQQEHRVLCFCAEEQREKEEHQPAASENIFEGMCNPTCCIFTGGWLLCLSIQVLLSSALCMLKLVRRYLLKPELGYGGGWMYFKN